MSTTELPRAGRPDDAPAATRTGAGAAPAVDARTTGPTRSGGSVPDRLRSRTLGCAVLAAPVVVMTAVPAWQFPWWQWVGLVLTVPILVWGALPVHRSALTDVRRGIASVDLLVSSTVLTAFAASLHGLLTTSAGTPGYEHAVPLTVLGGTGSGQFYPEVVAVVTTIALVVRNADRRAGRSDVVVTPSWVVPTVLLLAVGVAAYWSGGGAGRTGTIEIALAVLVAGCPVAATLAHPAAVLAVTEALRRRGTTLRAADALIAASQVTAILLTGPATLATNRPRPAGTTPCPGPVAVARLRGLGLDPVLLSGDPHRRARRQADRLGVEAVVAGLPPAERLAAVDRLRAAGTVVAVLGVDAVDGPVLAAADLGITGPTGAVRAADLVIGSGDPGDAVEALRLARRLPVVVRAGRRWAAGVTVPAVALAATGLLHPAVAALGPLLLGAAGVAAIVQGLRGPSPEWDALSPPPLSEEP